MVNLQELLDSDVSDVIETNIASNMTDSQKFSRTYRSKLSIPGSDDRFKIRFDFQARDASFGERSILEFSFTTEFGNEFNVQSTYEARPQPPKVMFKLFTWISRKLPEIIEQVGGVDQISFSAKSDDRGRVALYRRFAKMLGSEVEEHLRNGYLEFDVYPEGKNEIMQEFVANMKGHKNSKGEAAPWVIKDEDNGKIISSHKTKDEANKHLQQMHTYENAADEFIRLYLEDIGGIGGVGQSGDFQAHAPERMLGKPVTLNRPSKEEKKQQYDLKPFPGV